MPFPIATPVPPPACTTTTTTVAATPIPSPTPGVTPTRAPTTASLGISVPSGNFQRWEYVLKFDLPSRIAVMKNALGNSVTTVTGYWPPLATGQTDVGNLRVTNSNWTNNNVHVYTSFRKAKNISGVPGDVGYNPDWEDKGPACNVTTGENCNEFVYALDYSPNYGPDPGIPIDLYDENNHGRPIDNVGTSGPGAVTPWKENAPLNVIGSNADKVNFGLVVFSDRYITQAGQFDADSCNYSVTKNVGLTTTPSYDPIDTGNGGAVSTLLGEMFLGRDGGIVVGGGTATNVALDWAQNEIVNTFSRDPRWMCLRPYGVILVTDGESYSCNPNRVSWSVPPNNLSPCSTDASTQIARGLYLDFPPGRASDLWNQELLVPCTGGDGTQTKGRVDALGNPDPINPRTWVIGFGPQTSTCELDWTAFMGRTDASDPGQTAGYNWKNDPNFCQVWDPSPVPSPLKGSCTTRDSAVWANNFNPTNNYAFKATEAKEVAKALSKIVAATAQGDYTTSQGVAGGSVGTAAGGGSQIFILPSSDFPGWAGHLYKLNLSIERYPAKKLKDGSTNPYYDPTNPYQETGACVDLVSKTQNACLAANPTVKNAWTNLYRTDAAEVLQETSADDRKIYTWDPTDGSLVPVVASRLSDLAAIETVVTGQAATVSSVIVDYIRGNDGKGSPRLSRLGPMMNSTPAVVGGPAQYKQDNGIPSHAGFESTYANRQPLIWVGSDDGMLHAFNFTDMTEVLAILPPTLLSRQAVLYKNSLDSDNFSITGQPNVLDQDTHLYGVASSFRFGDVARRETDPATGKDVWVYHTVGFLTEGPGSDVVAALDVTHPYPGKCSSPPCDQGKAGGTDNNYGVFTLGGSQTNLPIQVLWSKTGGTGSGKFAGLNGSWSTPALGWIGSTAWAASGLRAATSTPSRAEPTTNGAPR